MRVPAEIRWGDKTSEISQVYIISDTKVEYVIKHIKVDVSLRNRKSSIIHIVKDMHTRMELEYDLTGIMG